MNAKNEIERWLKDEKFMAFANKRAKEEVFNSDNIYRNRRRRERDIWWVWIQLKYDGIDVEACIKYYAKLVEEVEKDIYTNLHREYVRMKRNQTSNKQ